MASGNDTRRVYVESEVNIGDAVIFFGSFALAGDDTDPTSARGEGFTVAHSGADDYVVTFAGKYPMCVSFVPTFEGAANSDLDVVVSNEAYDPTTGQVVIRLAKESTAALTRNDTLSTGRINFVACFHKYTALSVTHA